MVFPVETTVSTLPPAVHILQPSNFVPAWKTSIPESTFFKPEIGKPCLVYFLEEKLYLEV
jgi:hypothetical protein